LEDYSVFQILGPIMIGPSSSHTAGAAKLGKAAMEIAGQGFHKVSFHLHGSFAKTYKGHGTDRALVAGVLGMEPGDERLKDSFIIAIERGIKMEFAQVDLGYQHPNTVRIIFDFPDGRDIEVVGSSIGGGNINISEIDGHNVEISAKYPTLFIKHNDKDGMVSRVTSILARHKINIATMRVDRKGRGGEACMVIETDNNVPQIICQEIENLDGIRWVRTIEGCGDV
jgi:L-serine dehydratase